MVYLAQRLLATIPTVLGVVTLAFLLIHIAPGDPAGVLLAILVGVPSGIITAVRRNSAVDYATTTVAMLWLSGPSFWFGILLIYFLSYKLGWFPVFGAGTWGAVRSLLSHLVLPAVAIGVRSAALIARLTRSPLVGGG